MANEDPFPRDILPGALRALLALGPVPIARHGGKGTASSRERTARPRPARGRGQGSSRGHARDGCRMLYVLCWKVMLY
uniref:Uncharacterized protein n=1 Tax=Junco hyemalis TaxID=40217 RepID=A0A8C5JJB3_JUNHY